MAGSPEPRQAAAPQLADRRIRASDTALSSASAEEPPDDAQGHARAPRPGFPMLGQSVTGAAMIDGLVVFGLVGGALGAAESLPYVRDTLRRTTVPHRGSWLIWGVIEVIAVEAQRADGARWSLVPLATQALGTCVVFVLSIRLGSGGLSRVELALIALAGAGVAGWLAADEPLVATSCVITADFIAALMMLPKAWRDPGSETTSTFTIAALGGAMAVGSVGSSSVALLAYPLYFTLVNAALAAVIGSRRTYLSRPGERRVRVHALAPGRRHSTTVS